MQFKKLEEHEQLVLLREVPIGEVVSVEENYDDLYLVLDTSTTKTMHLACLDDGAVIHLSGSTKVIHHVKAELVY